MTRGIEEITALRRENEELWEQLREAQETLDAIRSGEVDALVVRAPSGNHVFTLQGADHPYRLFVEQMQQGAVTLGVSGIILYCNRRFADMMGGGDRALTGRPFTELVTPAFLAALEKLLVRGEAGPAAGEVELRTLTGEVIPAFLAVKAFPADNSPGLCMVVSDLTEQKHHERVAAAEERVRTVLESITDSFFALDPEWRFVEVNPRAAEYFQKSAGELRGRVKWEVFPEAVGGAFHLNLHRAMAEQAPQHFEAPSAIRDGWWEVHAYPTADRLEVYFRDISERKLAEQRLASSLREKEVLLREIHHRVKNNLQIIASLLSLQIAALRDDADRTPLLESQHRVRTIALIHEKLYGSHDLSSIPLDAYLADLGSYLHKSFAESARQVRLDFEMDPVRLEVGTAIPVALVSQELLSNAFKHAFPAGREGRVLVGLHSLAEGRCELSVEDDGRGFPAELNFRATESMGLQIVSILTQQLGGEMELHTNGGTRFTLAFQGASPPAAAPG